MAPHDPKFPFLFPSCHHPFPSLLPLAGVVCCPIALPEMCYGWSSRRRVSSHCSWLLGGTRQRGHSVGTKEMPYMVRFEFPVICFIFLVYSHGLSHLLQHSVTKKKRMSFPPSTSELSPPKLPSY